MMIRPILLTLLALVCAVPPLQAADAPLNPAQTAYLRSEAQKAEEAFVREVAKALSTSPELVRKAMPAPGRITDPVAHLQQALPRDLKRALSDEEKAAIVAADQRRLKTLLAAQAAAKRK
jgi:hypothetical protein